jgi:hypothetical protein
MATSKEKPESSKASSKPTAKATKPSSASETFGDNISGTELAGGLVGKGGAVAAVGLGVSVVLGMMQNDAFRRFSFAYLTAYMWALSVVLGGVFWVTLQHLVNAKWSIALRRVGELIANAAPIFGLLSLPIVIPVLLGHDTLYVWADHAKVEADHVLHHKAGYLNPQFFIIRMVFYFGFWTLLARYFLKQSVAQDKAGTPDVSDRLQRVAGPGMIAFALTLTFFAIDLVMALDPYWFSTIFGVYYFASCVLAINSALVLAQLWLQSRGRLTKSLTEEHLHDLGKMMFAFTIFWAYIGFSQFMLIWYANLPEETSWFKERFAGEWGNLSWGLLLLHFVVPFFGMLSRHVKRNRKWIAFWAIWILVEIYVDMYWLIMPNLKTEEIPLSLVDITCWIGMAGALIAAIAVSAKNVNLLPVNDPRLPRSLAFENI